MSRWRPLLLSALGLVSCRQSEPIRVSSAPPASSTVAAAPQPTATTAASPSGDEHLGPKDNPALRGEHPLTTLMRELKSTPLPELSGKHPRVFTTQSRLTELRQQAKTTHKALWQPVLGSLAALAAEPPPAPAQERRAQNAVGLAIAEAALAYQIERDPKLLAAAKKYMDAAVSYDVWGYTYNKPNVDLAAGHLLYGLGWAYDLLYDELTPAERQKYREKLTRQANLLYQYYLPKQGRTYAYSQNHVFIPNSGLAVAAYALHGEVPEAAEWAKLSRAIMSRVLDTYSNDGYYYEGFEYWVFSTPWLILWLSAHQHVTGEDLFDRPGLRHMHRYIAHTILPDGKNVFDFGDAFTGPKTRQGVGDDYARTHPGGRLHSNYNILYALARRFGDGEIQGVADRLHKQGQVSFFDYHSLLFYDHKLSQGPAKPLPTFAHFADHEVAYFRTDWSASATALAFKCGPPEGHSALEKMKRFPDWHSEAGHSHPDANSFILYGGGQYLTGDSGYAGVPMTDQQNALLIDGKGQAREGHGHNAFKHVPYERLNQLRIEVLESSPGKLRLLGHAAPAYEPELGLLQFDREITLTSANELLIRDRVKARSKATFTALFHADDSIVKEAETRFAIDAGKTRLSLSIVSPSAPRSLIEPNWLTGPGRPGSVAKGEREARGQRLRIDNPSPVSELELVTRLTISPRGGTP